MSILWTCPRPILYLKFKALDRYMLILIATPPRTNTEICDCIPCVMLINRRAQTDKWTDITKCIISLASRSIMMSDWPSVIDTCHFESLHPKMVVLWVSMSRKLTQWATKTYAWLTHCCKIGILSRVALCSDVDAIKDDRASALKILLCFEDVKCHNREKGHMFLTWKRHDVICSLGRRVKPGLHVYQSAKSLLDWRLIALSLKPTQVWCMYCLLRD